ncbi:glycosyltransferase family 4 protein [Singulisphaera acidiphila]|uniref:Glycosyltransferase n=1 Tax=Singulisphaera acidiphila (strain ATCC BAA-1392 / DSM 18658 / VKM B-2454 / MOB10) TaxID=886293 RepID=L0DFU0_SINAD|nr:glycosyltransferase family 4 protein [Singulisphaera acidiphila]AGA28127.1 glycosyltransferase [Singulisphaera acidiphila DSM 18658]
MRVTLVNSSLAGGGAERVMATMANFWARKGWSVTLLTLSGAEAPDFYEVDPAVHRRRLGIAGASSSLIGGLRMNLTRMRVLRRSIRESRPDVVISFQNQTNVLVLLCCLGLKLPVIVSERSDPFCSKISRTWRLLRQVFYPLAACIVLQTDSVRAYFGRRVRRKAKVIPNPVEHVNDPGKAVEAGPGREGRVLATAGRLNEVKGFDLLIRAFASVVAAHPDWTLVIWGEGPIRDDLEALRDQLGLGDRVRLPGATKMLAAKLRDADLYVLSSRHEGFPNVLCEAMALGLPVVSFDCPSGPRHIVRDGVDGVLVPAKDVDALAAVLSRLMADDKERNRLAARAPEVLERFALKVVMGLWEEAIHGVSGRKPVAREVPA